MYIYIDTYVYIYRYIYIYIYIHTDIYIYIYRYTYIYLYIDIDVYVYIYIYTIRITPNHHHYHHPKRVPTCQDLDKKEVWAVWDEACELSSPAISSQSPHAVDRSTKMAVGLSTSTSFSVGMQNS